MNSERDKRVYNLAKNFLIKEFEKHGSNAKAFEAFLIPPGKPGNLIQIYKKLLVSGQNAERMPKVIKSGIGDRENLGEVLFNFDYLKVLEKYGTDAGKLHSDIMKRFNIKKGEKTWKRYSKTMLSGAKFLSQFKDHSDFDSLIKSFPKDERAQYTAALFLKEEILGFGLALSCDFLKSIGYSEFGKPDVIVKRIFEAVTLTEDKQDYMVLKAIGRVAKNSSVTPYNVDKVFWLLGGNLRHEEIAPQTGKKGSFFPNNKDRERRFIVLANSSMS